MPRLIVDMSEDLFCHLEEVARRRGLSRDEAMRRAFSLLFMADEEKEKGNSLVVVRDLPNNRIRPIARIEGAF